MSVDHRSTGVLVIGCGMAGLSAGLAASEAGADVTVLEKSPPERRGGHTRFTESFRVPTADLDLADQFNVEYTPSEFYSDIMEVTNYAADDAIVEVLTTEAAPTVQWLADHGVEFETDPPHPGYTAGRVWLDGEGLVADLVDALEGSGATVVYDAEARSLVRSDEGRVSAVRARVDGRAVTFEADAVVLAAGDYGSSKEKRVRYYGTGFENMKVRGSRYNTGEAIEAALDVGAKTEGEWSGAHMAIVDAATPDIEGGITRIDGYQYGVMLNHDGKRFVDEGEDARAHTYAKFGRIIFQQPYHEAFIIVDSTVDDDVAHMGPSRPITAESIGSLATRLGIDAGETAVETIQAYNEACDPAAKDAYDPDRLDGNAATGIEPPKSNWALPIDEPPFTGYPVTGGFTFGFGGVAVTAGTAVLDTRDEVIPGLYAAGNATGGLFYENYPGGTGLTNAAVFGRIAGERAAAAAGERD